MESSNITVVIAVRNSARTLEHTLRSVVEQTLSDVECIVIDGASTDGSRDLIERYRDHIAYTVSEPDSGPYDAFNKGVDRATGDWIMFLGSDDVLSDRTTLSQAAIRLAQVPLEQLVAYGRVEVVTRDGTTIGIDGGPWPRAKRRFHVGMGIPHPATFHHRRLFQKHCHFDNTFRIAGDYEFLLRELKTADAADLGELVVTRMTIGGLSSNPRNARLMLAENRRARAMHGLGKGWRERLFADWQLRLRITVHELIGDRAATALDNAVRRLRGLPPWDTE
jgi:glycosyltransferase involved in cell wall biosynthesis